jgi:uncharacterized protein YbjT (DUF2867 family)
LAAELGNLNIIIAGSTGLIGSLLLKRLSSHDLTLIGRRANPEAPPNAPQLTGDAADWPRLMAGVKCDVAICTLGTTMAQAGSKLAFAAVDHDAVIAFAKAAKACGARQFMLVSSVGANPKASNFYLATKGQAEAGVKAIGFDRADIFRPGLLRGARGGAARPVERLMISLSPITNLLTPSMFDHYRAIDADDVASAMARCVGKAEEGAFVHHNREMWAA